MKTILVVYTNVKFTNKEIADNKLTKYAFRTSEDVEVGDLIESKDYGKSMQVTDVIDADYKFYNTQTGELRNESTLLRCILSRQLSSRKKMSL